MTGELLEAGARRLDARATRRRIEEAALALFIDKGIAETSTRDIATAAGVAEGTLYRHFVGKEALGFELFRRQHAALARIIDEAQAEQATLGGKADAIVAGFCAAADANWALFTFHLMAQNRYLPQVNTGRDNPVDKVEGILERAVRAGELAPCDTRLLASMALGVVLHPVDAIAYGRLAGPLAPMVPTLQAAVRRVLGLV